MNYLNSKSAQVQALQGGATLVLVPMKPQPVYRENASIPGHFGTWCKCGTNLDHPFGRHPDSHNCAPYRVGQRVGVREMFEVLLKDNAFTDPDEYGYFADDPSPKGQCWQPPSKMPERAIRLWFEVSAVRAIKCSEINEEDALKAGSEVAHCPGGAPFTAAQMYRFTWDKLYPRHPWETSWAFGFEGVVTK